MLEVLDGDVVALVASRDEGNGELGGVRVSLIIRPIMVAVWWITGLTLMM